MGAARQIIGFEIVLKLKEKAKESLEKAKAAKAEKDHAGHATN